MKRSRTLGTGLRSLALFSLVFASPKAAQAGGLYLSERGVRPLGRGGAMVAGADDLHATWMNPAGLADAKSSAMLDLSMMILSADYARQTSVVDGSGAVRTVGSPTVSGSTLPVPIPLIGGSLNFGPSKEYTAAISVYAPNSPIVSWPAELGGAPSPQRYMVLSLEGSALAIVGGYFAWKPVEEIRIGAGLQALVGSFVAKTVFNANPGDRLLGAPEDPNYDATAQLKVGPIFAPSANFGATVVPDKHVHLGLSVQLPFLVRSPGTLSVRLPSAPVFDNARQEGKDVRVKFNLPFILRAGVEVRPDDDLRIEAAYVREFWSSHRSIDLEPENIKLIGVTGFPSPFSVAGISLPKGYQDTHSFRLGGERRFALSESENAISGRLGVMYEPTAIPKEYLSAVGLDADKVIVGLGGSFHLSEAWRFDAVVSQVFAGEVSVDPATAKIPRVNPVKGNPTESEAVNGGTYKFGATVLGVAGNYRF